MKRDDTVALPFAGAVILARHVQSVRTAPQVSPKRFLPRVVVTFTQPVQVLGLRTPAGGVSLPPMFIDRFPVREMPRVSLMAFCGVITAVFALVTLTEPVAVLPALFVAVAVMVLDPALRGRATDHEPSGATLAVRPLTLTVGVLQ